MATRRRDLRAARRWLYRSVKDAYHTNLRDGGPPRAVVIVLGSQRSGTTALLRAMEHDWNARVFGEFSALNVDPLSCEKPPEDPRKFTIRWRPLGEVALRIRRSPYPLVVCKPLAESHRARDLLERIESSRCVWMFRSYRDVAESRVRRWPDHLHVRNLEPIVRAEAGNWRSELVPDDVRALVTKHYAVDMNPYDGAALFWYARNRLLFDLELVGDSRLMMLRYEHFATQPAVALQRIYDFVGLPFPGPRMARSINAKAVGRGAHVRLNDEVEARCEELWCKLLSSPPCDARPRRSSAAGS